MACSRALRGEQAQLRPCRARSLPLRACCARRGFRAGAEVQGRLNRGSIARHCRPSSMWPCILSKHTVRASRGSEVAVTP